MVQLQPSRTVNALAANALTDPSLADRNNSQFADITGHWAADFIQALAAHDLIKGTAVGKFEPDALITRAQYAAFIAKAFQLPPARSSYAFTDVSVDFWGHAAVQQVYQSGLMAGFDSGLFAPNQPILRCHSLLPCVKALKLPPANPSILERFEDAGTIPDYAKAPIASALQAELIVNYPRLRQFKPTWEATRAEVAALLYQALVYQKHLPELRSPYIIQPNQPNQAEPHPAETVMTVVIDPGHGGSDPGAVGIDGLQEKRVIFPIAQELVRLLQQQNIKALLTRTDDRELDLAPRVEFAQQVKADLFVSIHANSAGLNHPQVSGLETYHHAESPESGRLATTLHQQILQTVEVVDRGVRQANFFVLRQATMPAVLIETGFVTGQADAAKLGDPTYQRQLASAIAQGILAYVRSRQPS